jgi:hypothetical protein
VTREGQQSGIETYAVGKFAPWFPISSRVRGIAAMSRTVWSSVVSMITFGLLAAASERSPGISTVTAIRQARMPATQPALAIRRT